MSDEENEIRRLFTSLPAPRKAQVLAALRHDHAEELRRAGEMVEELKAMGFSVPPLDQMAELSMDRRRRPAPKYRSKVNPELTWSGRGNMARWLIEEMKETGLPLEAFLASR